MTLVLDLCARGAGPTAGLRGIDTVRDSAARCDRLPARPRHPYAGELVRMAFRGTRRDAEGRGPAGHARRAREAGVAAASVRAVPSAVNGAAR
ncbi:2-isopropylmalate synthase [Streptomyces sp. enrichment culture]